MLITYPLSFISLLSHVSWSQIHSLLSNNYIYIYMGEQPTEITQCYLISIFIGLIIWYWKMNQVGLSLRKTNPLSLRSLLLFTLLLYVRFEEICPKDIGMSAGTGIVQILSRKPCCRDFTSIHSFSFIPSRHKLTMDMLVLWLLQCFLSFLWNSL